MDGDTQARIWNVFEEALGYDDTAARIRFIREACAEDLRMADEVRSLVEAHQAESILDEPALLSATGPRSVGERIGPYVIHDEIGRGGMGVVCRARDDRLDRWVALKMLPRHLSRHAGSKARLAAEARAAAQLEHPNIATVYDMGETPDGRMYIAMAYYSGETLDRRIANGPLPLDETLDLIGQIAAGLTQAHEAGIVHRDIKPGNILVTPEGTVKILDFGIAKLADLSLTRSGEAVGTVAYMSPEQVRGGDVDHRSDVWSLAILLFEILTGERPFTGNYNDAILYSIVHEPAPVASSIRADLPQGVDAVISTALQKERDKRYRSAGELAAALAGAVTDAVRPEPPAAASTPERVRATVIVSQLDGFLELVDRLVPDELRALVNVVHDRAAAVVDAHGGSLHEVSDDMVTAVFGIPTVHEDDFVRAVRAARDFHEAVRRIADEYCGTTGCELRLSTGIDTGSVVTRPGPDGVTLRITGSPVQTARRLSLRAGLDEILVSPDTERLVRPFFQSDVAEDSAIRTSDGTLTPSRIQQETGSATRLEAATESGLTQYAGRERDVEALLDAMNQAEAGAGQMIAVVGEAGIGKSRLLYEFSRRVGDDVRLLNGRCVQHAGSLPYLPFEGVLREQLELSDAPSEVDVRDRVLAVDESLDVYLPLYMHLLSVDGEHAPVPDLQEENLRVAMVEALSGIVTLGARSRPLLLLLEDWHWSDDASQEVLKQLADLAPSHAMMIVATYRPEYEGRPLGHHGVIHLKPLDLEPTRTMMASVIGTSRIPEDLGRLIHGRTGGNPFFLEEICRSLLEADVLTQQDDSAVMVRSVDALDLPDTVQAVIRARLHRLGPDTRRTLRVASVAGREFTRGLLRSVLPDSDDLASQLDELIELGLVQKSAVVPEMTYRFKHALTQEVVYETLLHHQRKSFHRKIGAALEDLYGQRVDEHLDQFIHHFRLAEEWRRAAHYSRLAAGRARGLGQLGEAAKMLEKAVEWLAPEIGSSAVPDEYVKLLLDLERASEATGDRHRQQAILDELKGMLEPDGDDTALAEIYLRQGDLHVLRNRLDEAEAVLHAAVKHAERSEDEEVYRRVLRSVGFLRWYQGRTQDVVDINERLYEMHVGIDDYDAAAGDLVNLHNALMSVDRYDDALAYAERAESIMDRVRQPSVRAGILYCAGSVHGILGNTDRAMEYLNRAVAIADQHGLPSQQAYALTAQANVYLKMGDTDACIESYEKTVALMRDACHMEGLTKSLSVLGQILVSLDRHDEAEVKLSEAAELFQKLDDVQSEAETLVRIARIQEETGRLDEAERRWNSVAERLERLNPTFELDVVEAFAGLARRRGDDAEALSHYYDAIELAAHLQEPVREVQLRNTAGIMEWDGGRFEAALAQYEKALPLVRAEELKGGTGLIMNSMAACLQRLERYEDALSVLLDAIEVHRQAENRKLEAHAQSLLGDVHLASGRAEEAREAYSSSLKLRWELDDREGEGWMLQRLARSHAALGDDDRAAAYAEQSRTIARELDDPIMESACRTVWGL